MDLPTEFMRVFKGLDRAHGTYAIIDKGGKTKVDGRAITLSEPVTIEKWEKHLAGTSAGIGIVPIDDDANVHWSAIDIDDYALDHQILWDKIQKLSLPLIICRSKSGGAHLYVFYTEPVSAKLSRGKLMEWVIALGCKPGTEIFPKQIALANRTDIGNWINMPYFNADDTQRYALYNGQKLSAEKFIKYIDEVKISLSDLEAFNVDLAGGAFSDGPPCLQSLAATGFPQGTRNMGLFNMGVYCRNKYGDEWQPELEDMNRKFMNPPLASSEVTMAVKSLSKKVYFFTCDKQPLVQCCNKEICKTRKYGIGGGGSDDIPVIIGSITRINSEIPTFFIEVEGVRMEVDPGDLLVQERFRLLCIEKINKLPTKMKQPDWEKIIRERLENIEIIEAPDDSGPAGQFYLHLESFCTNRHKARAIDELLLGKPFAKDDGRTYFRSTDLIKYLDQQHFKDFKENKIWALLRDIGGEHHQLDLKGKITQSWSIKTPDEQKEEFNKGVF